MEYKASLDTPAKIISGIVFILFAYLIARSVKAMVEAGGDRTVLLVQGLLLLLLVVILAISFAFAPQKYLLENAELIIKRPISDRHIPIINIEEIRPLEEGELSGTLRTFGVGGLFGYYGKFYNAKLGSMNWYATHRKNCLLIRLVNGEKIILSPDDMSLATEIRSRLMGRK